MQGSPDKYCACCGYAGPFYAVGNPPRYGAQCPACGGLERHRLLALAADERELFTGREVLHFAPEAAFVRFIQPKARRYVTADLIPGRADRVMNIEALDAPNESWDVILCSHVLEHVDDRLALSEMFRVLRCGGLLIVMVPIIEGWDRTYEEDGVATDELREAHYGQSDHVRYYGRDLRERIARAGFSIDTEYTAFGGDVVKYSLLRGEKVFLCRKAAA